MKKMKKIMAAAIAMMTFSTAAAVTGTVAWFTASNIVVADGIYLQADKEEGFVINNEGLAEADWGASVKASHDGSYGNPKAQGRFIPTSTVDATAWYHANAEHQNVSNAANGTVFSALETSLVEADSGVYKATISEGMNKNLYLLNSFYLKASTTAILNADGLHARVSAVSLEDTPVSTELNNTLRVLVRYGVGNDTNSNGIIDGQETYTYYGATVWAPFRTAETDAARSYNVGGTIAADGTRSGHTAVTAIRGDVSAQLGNAAVAIPANNLENKAVNLFQVQVFAYYEGEDVDCKSDNIKSTLDKVSVTVKISTQTIA